MDPRDDRNRQFLVILACLLLAVLFVALLSHYRTDVNEQGDALPLVLAGAPGRTIDQVAREQINNLLKDLKTGTDAENFVLQQFDAVIAGIKQTDQIPLQPLLNVKNSAQVPALIKTQFLDLFSIVTNEFWAGELQVVPTTLVRKYRGPVLILQGTSDQNVFSNEDTPLLNEALAQRPHDDHFTLLVPGASHFLKQVTATNPGITGPVVPQVLFTLPFWLHLKLDHQLEWRSGRIA